MVTIFYGTVIVMAETQLTKDVKKTLLLYTKADQLGIYGCYEVCFGYNEEYCDFMTMDSKNVFRCYEIKSSMGDLRSKAKLTFKGDFNYIVIPEELFEKDSVQEILKPYLWRGVGVLLYRRKDNGNINIHELQKAKRQTLYIGDRVKIMDYMVRSLSRYTTKLFM
mgnify:CR=1 FL=1